MQSIKQFVDVVTHARKRTGVIWLNRPEILSELKMSEIKLINLAEQPLQSVIISDDQLITMLTGSGYSTGVAFLNLEICLGPRFKDLKYLSFLLPKLTVQEPRQPVFFAFYSGVLYQKFRDHYINQKQTETHFYEEP